MDDGSRLGRAALGWQTPTAQWIDSASPINFVPLFCIDVKGTLVAKAMTFEWLTPTMHAGKADPGSWVMGHGWEEVHWGGKLPTAEWIDSASPKNPVLLYRMDVHMALINSAAMKLAAINGDTVEPEGGKLVLDDDGKPPGILV